MDPRMVRTLVLTFCFFAHLVSASSSADNPDELHPNVTSPAPVADDSNDVRSSKQREPWKQMKGLTLNDIIIREQKTQTSYKDEDDDDSPVEYQSNNLFKCDMDNMHCFYHNFGNFPFIRTSYDPYQPGQSQYKPPVDSTTGTSSGYYMYVDMTGQSAGRWAGMSTRPINTGPYTTFCVKFKVYSNGVNPGALSMFTAEDNKQWEERWTETVNLESAWQQFSVSFQVQGSSTFRIIFRAHTIAGTNSVIAVDDVTLSIGPCATTPVCEWSTWTACSATCGSGTRRKIMSCSGRPDQIFTDVCTSLDCDVKWNAWSAWSSCPSTCSENIRDRHRTCSGSGCQGRFSEVQKCGHLPCGYWSSWTPCDASCGPATKSRRRVCEGGPCADNREETLQCNNIPCPVPAPGPSPSPTTTWCLGVTEVFAGNGYIASPRYGDGRTYPSNVNCKWVIRSAQNTVVELYMLRFVTEVAFDSLTVHNGPSESSPVLQIISGDRTGLRMTTTTSEAFLQFKSDAAVNNEGFFIQFQAVPKRGGIPGGGNGGGIGTGGTGGSGSVSTSGQPCSPFGQVLHGSPHTIYSPGFQQSRNYSNNLDCKWQMTAAAGTNIRVQIHTVSSEPVYDGIIVYDGLTRTDEPIGVFSGTGLDGIVVQSTGNDVLVRFRSDDTLTGTGFSATLSQVYPSQSPSGQCGVHVHSTSSLNNIIGGIIAQPGSIPWQVSLVQRTKAIHFCGGVLLNKRWVLTAGHCFRTPGNPLGVADFTVYVGGHARLSGLRYLASRVLVHSGFSYQTKVNDIALVELSRDVTFSSRVTPICLPTRKTVPGDSCYTSGWGYTTYPTGKASDYLRQTQISVVGDDRCRYNNYGAGQICVGENPSVNSMYKGDSGGPLACHVDGRYTVGGVASYSTISKSGPDVFSDVHYYLTWIKQIMNSPAPIG